MASANDRLRRFDESLQEVCGPMLEAAGFDRAGRTRLWIRSSESAKGVEQLVWFQVGESASLQGGQFTVEFGIYYPNYDRFANGRKLLGPVIGSCHFDVRMRLGELLQPREDRWWRYSGTCEEVTDRVKSVASLVAEFGLPWLAATDSLANAALYNTGKLPEPDRLRREEYEQRKAIRTGE